MYLCVLPVIINGGEGWRLWGAKNIENERRTEKMVGSTMMGIRAAVSVRFRQTAAGIPPGTAAAVCG